MLFDTLTAREPPSQLRLFALLLVWIALGAAAFYHTPDSTAGAVWRLFSIGLDAIMIGLSLWAIYRRRVEQTQRTAA